MFAFITGDYSFHGDIISFISPGLCSCTFPGADSHSTHSRCRKPFPISGTRAGNAVACGDHAITITFFFCRANTRHLHRVSRGEPGSSLACSINVINGFSAIVSFTGLS